MVDKLKITPEMFSEWKSHPVTHNLRISIKERIIDCERILYDGTLEYSDHYERTVSGILSEMELLRSLDSQFSDFRTAKPELDQDENEEEKE